MFPILALAVSAFAIEPDTAAQAPKVFHHGFRLGYAYLAHAEDYGVRPDLFVFGYELNEKIIGGQWLDVILVENVMLAGVNQGLAVPSANFLVGVELADCVQVGTGMNLSPIDMETSPLKQIIAVGYMPKVGRIQVPVHVSFIPDDDHWRIAATTGVNW